MMKNRNVQSGEMNVLVIPLVLVCLVAVSLAGFAGWAYLQYTDYRDNVQSKIDVAVAAARKDQQSVDAKEFAEREKEPYETFVGPSELGRIEFKYPKTWSVYVANEGDGGNFEAALHPKQVHPIDSRRPYALHVQVINRSYESVIEDYKSAVEEGELRSEPVTVNGFNGVMLSGKFSDQVPNGKMVLFKNRDKALTVATQAPQFFADYQNIILETLRFNP